MRKAARLLCGLLVLAGGCAAVAPKTQGEPWTSLKVGMTLEETMALQGGIHSVTTHGDLTTVLRYQDGSSITFASNGAGTLTVREWNRPSP